jgi:Tfp pilus assembly protein PilX
MNANFSRHARSMQRGVALIIVMISLLIMAFAAAAMLRSTDTATLIAGNLGFKKTAQATGDAGTEAAIAWLGVNAGSAVLHADIAGSGYWSSSQEACDLTGQRTPGNAADDVNWAGGAAAAGCPMVALAANPAGVAPGFTISYVVNRVCNAPGDPASVVAADGVTPMVCSRQTNADSSNSTRSAGLYGNTPLSGVPQTYYRITTRVLGPRNTVRFVQAFVVI